MKKKSIIAIVSVLVIAIVGGIALPLLSKLFPNEKISINDIQAMVSKGSIDVTYQDNGSIQWIDGTFTDVVVDSKEDAVKVFQLSSDLLGEKFSATEDYISHQTAEDDSDSAEHFYRYSPIINGVSVVGSQAILSTDKEGKVTGLFSTYNDSIYNINTAPDISEEEALDKAWETLLSNEEIDTFLSQYVSDNLSKSDVIAEFKDSMTTNVKLQIYAAADENEPLLVYSVSVYNKVDSPAIIDNDGNDVYTDSPINIESANDPETVSADFVMIDMTYYFLASGDNAGELHNVLNNIQGWDTVQLTAKDQRGNTRVFYAQTKDGKFRLRDAARNLETYKTTFGNLLWIEPKLPGKLVEFTSSISPVAVSAHANMSTVYDYYLYVLGRKSFDGNGKKVISSYDYDNCQFIFTGNYKNASWMPGAQQFVFGDKGNFASGLDIVAHEFTHAVINYIVGNGHDVTLTYYGESGALNEAYADIMGCLIEGKADEGLWLCGEDVDEVLRSMKDPSAYDQPEHYKDRYTGGNDHGGVHTNSGIFNHAAYKMITDKRTSGIELTTWAKVFYRSLFRLTSDATFTDARGAIISAAKNIGFSSEQINAIKDAFDAVGIRSGINESTVPDTNTSTPTENNESSHNSVDDNVSNIQNDNHTCTAEWRTTMEATCSQYGEKICICTKCGKIHETQQIEKLEHSYTSVVTAPTDTEQGFTTHSCNKCGDKYVDSWTDPNISYSTGLTYEVLGDGMCAITGIGTCKDAKLNIPPVIDGYKVVKIAQKAFYKCKSLTSVTIPNSVIVIGTQAFSRCDSLTSITIPNSVTDISSYAFYHCDSLTSITIPNSVDRIYSCAFSDCIGLVNVTIESGSIGMEAFSSCYSLANVTIGNGVTAIGVDAFYDCDSLTNITIPNSVDRIYSCAFSDCNSLVNVFIENGTIGEGAFMECENLVSVTIGNGVTAIGVDAFDDCPKLTSAIFKDTSGWYVVNYDDEDEKYDVYVADPAKAATFLQRTGYDWYKK